MSGEIDDALFYRVRSQWYSYTFAMVPLATLV